MTKGLRLGQESVVEPIEDDVESYSMGRQIVRGRKGPSLRVYFKEVEILCEEDESGLITLRGEGHSPEQATEDLREKVDEFRMGMRETRLRIVARERLRAMKNLASTMKALIRQAEDRFEDAKILEQATALYPDVSDLEIISVKRNVAELRGKAPTTSSMSDDVQAIDKGDHLEVTLRIYT